MERFEKLPVNINLIPSGLPRAQSGAVLAVALIILLVLSFIGIFALQSASLEEKMTSNIRDLDLSIQSTESALREGENYIETLADTSGFGTGGGLYSSGNAPDPFTASTWTGASSIVTAGSYGNVVQPRYFIEFVGQVDANEETQNNIVGYGQGSADLISIFRVVAQGTGGTGNTQVIFQSYYGKRL